MPSASDPGQSYFCSSMNIFPIIIFFPEVGLLRPQTLSGGWGLYREQQLCGEPGDWGGGRDMSQEAEQRLLLHWHQHQPWLHPGDDEFSWKWYNKGWPPRCSVATPSWTISTPTRWRTPTTAAAATQRWCLQFMVRWWWWCYADKRIF